MKAGGNILSIEVGYDIIMYLDKVFIILLKKYNSLEEPSDSTVITEKRKNLQKELDKWKLGITDRKNNEDIVEIPKELNPIVISSSDDEEQNDESKEESESKKD